MTGSLRHRGIGYMQNMRAFKSVCPLRNELHLDITTAVKVTALRGHRSRPPQRRGGSRRFCDCVCRKGARNGTRA